MTSSNMASHLIVTHRETSMLLSIKFEIGIFIDGTIFICKKLSKYISIKYNCNMNMQYLAEHIKSLVY